MRLVGMVHSTACDSRISSSLGIPCQSADKLQWARSPSRNQHELGNFLSYAASSHDRWQMHAEARVSGHERRPQWAFWRVVFLLETTPSKLPTLWQLVVSMENVLTSGIPPACMAHFNCRCHRDAASGRADPLCVWPAAGHISGQSVRRHS